MAGKNKEIELLGELIKATEEGRITWRPTAKLNEFAASFRGHFSALISKQDNGECHLRIVDEDGRELLHRFDSPPSRPLDGFNVVRPLSSGIDWSPALVSNLFDLARRTGLNVDKAIDEILQGLKSA